MNTEDTNTSTKSTAKFVGLACAVLALALVSALGSTGLARGAIPTKANKHSISSPTTITSLVQKYNRVESFTGSDNNLLPKTLASGIHLGAVDVVIPSKTPGITEKGYIYYGGYDGARIIASSSGAKDDRFGIIIDRPLFTGSYALPVKLPSGAMVTNESSGAIVVASASGVTTLAPATAVDAAGKVIPVRYRIVDRRLLISLESGDATYPILIDPVSSSYWWGTQTWYSRSDVRQQASSWAIINIARAVCIPLGRFAGVCNSVISLYTNWIVNTWSYAKNTNQCLTMRMTWTGQIIGINAYGCNWG